MNTKTIIMNTGIFTLVIALMAVLTTGCSTTNGNTPGTATPAKAGAELWAQNCVRCHNARSPDNYSDAQWEVVGMHMRVRANLTGEEQRVIVAFLKNAH